jgi:UDP-N-acetylglucosamine 2-epimerase
MKIVTYAATRESPRDEVLADALAKAGVDSATARLGPDPSGDSATAVLAARLVEWENLLERVTPAGLVLSGDDDSALAAVLSAVKLEVPVAAFGTGELVRLLASAVVDPAAEEAASEIAAWAEALPTLPAR